MKKSSILRGAFILSLGGFITKLLGAIYRIPLTNLLGAKRIGLYQMVFPFYALVLTFSSTGVPSGMSKLVAEGNNPVMVLKSSIKTFGVIGFILSLITAIFSRQIASFQGNEGAGVCYLILSPSIFLVSIISCFRGYFQGFSNMRPTAFSQVLEQLSKVAFGLTLCYMVRDNVLLAVSLAVLSVTLSEVITLIYFLFKVKKQVFYGLLNEKTNLKPIFSTVIPMMAITLIVPLIRTVDSFLIINIISNYSSKATELYGILTGAVESVISLPTTLCYAIAISSIPVISRLKKSGENYFYESVKTISITIVLASLLGVLTYIFSPLIIKLLYGGLGDYGKTVAIETLKISSLSVVFLSLMQTSVAIVNALGKFRITLLSGILGGVFKIILSILLLSNPKINIFGAIYSDIVCYFVACFVNLGYIIYNDVKRRLKNVQDNRYRVRG